MPSGRAGGIQRGSLLPKLCLAGNEEYPAACFLSLDQRSWPGHALENNKEGEAMRGPLGLNYINTFF